MSTRTSDQNESGTSLAESSSEQSDNPNSNRTSIEYDTSSANPFRHL